tara:strand:+ start:118 stop:549 length:432 start_codon:yes stop_codon:yes gene_type:complete
MPIKTFRGLIPNGETVKLSLATNNGSIGYRLMKFQIMPVQSYNNYEITSKLFKTEPGAPSSDVNLSDNTIVGVAFSGLADGKYAGAKTVIMDRDVFNQDIYITAVDNGGSQDCNFYLELETMTLDLNENTLVTLKDIRNTDSQ